MPQNVWMFHHPSIDGNVEKIENINIISIYICIYSVPGCVSSLSAALRHSPLLSLSVSVCLVKLHCAELSLWVAASEGSTHCRPGVSRLSVTVGPAGVEETRPP